ncbi:MAG TPA: hypothetical protein VK495_13655, partial [Steroidobacteraceae bacterium]|nr:hypothetical protein [Steroidobacteraceae bacterium]
MKAALIVSMGLLALGGCASQVVSIRTVPAQTPAADSAAAAANAAAFAEAVAAEAVVAEPAPGSPVRDGPPAVPLLTPADAPPMYTYDPWERFNRSAFRFNAR